MVNVRGTPAVNRDVYSGSGGAETEWKYASDVSGWREAYAMLS